MSKMIQLRNVPESLHRKLKARAALQGLSLSDYLIREIEEVAAKPTVDEIRHRLRQRTSIVPKISPARAIREERERK
jgi:antitoxin FitA